MCVLSSVNIMKEARGLECLWDDISKHPQCEHGPTLLFGKFIDGNLEKFYACSACRDRKLCKFYMRYEDVRAKTQKNVQVEQTKKATPYYNHQKLYIRFNELLAENCVKRVYCHNCERLIFISEKHKHSGHEVTEGLTDYQMYHPTELLKPLGNSKKEAQYLFSKKSTEEISNMLLNLGAKQVLCIGTPRLHEHITEHHEDKMSSLLLDFDARFHNFFGPLSYCWYNLFNHHFFNEDGKDVFKDFMTQNSGKDTYLICDPPFGGRVEAMSCTIKKIVDLHRKWNNIKDEKDNLKIMFVFPYFMESVMKEKSNPPNIDGGLKELLMTDYRVDYDNHPLFITGSGGRKCGSPVRIFTNVPLKLLELPACDGYKYCKRCEKWVSAENKHCKKCKECTSKDGRRYKHCNLCERCVKPSWKHCDTCKRCCLEKHVCGKRPNITGACFKCQEYGHTSRECEAETKGGKKSEVKKTKKRKMDVQQKTRSFKKRKTFASEENVTVVKAIKKPRVNTKQDAECIVKSEKPTRVLNNNETNGAQKQNSLIKKKAAKTMALAEKKSVKSVKFGAMSSTKQSKLSNNGIKKNTKKKIKNGIK